MDELVGIFHKVRFGDNGVVELVSSLICLHKPSNSVLIPGFERLKE